MSVSFQPKLSALQAGQPGGLHRASRRNDQKVTFFGGLDNLRRVAGVNLAGMPWGRTTARPGGRRIEPMTITEPYPAELIWIARKVVWFDAPEQTLQDLKTFLSHLMVYGAPAEVAVVERYIPRTSFGKCWKTRRPGCSRRKPGRVGMNGWGCFPIPPLPRRRFPDGTFGPEPGTFFGR